MRSKNVLAVLLVSSASLFWCPGASRAAEPAKQGPSVLAPAEWGVGELVEDVAFTDLDGKAGKLSDYRGRPLVVFMNSVTCPVGRRYGPRVAEIVKRYAGKDIQFLVVNPTAHDTVRQMKGAAARTPAARYVHDEEGRIARALRAVSTTDVFVLDAARTLAYRGAIDEQYGLGYALPEAKKHYLVDAIEATLAGRTPAVRATSAPGCAVEGSAKAEPAGGVTYHNRISRLVQNNCQECHRPGEAAPFALSEFKDVKGRAKTIKRVVENGVMPPWFADAAHGAWENDSRLSERDRADLLKWIDGGTPEGDPADAPVARQWAAGWRFGTPDMVLETPRAFKVPAAGTVPYQHVTVQTKLEEDKWVSAVEVRASQPQVVHHVLVFVMFPEGHPRKAEQPQFRGGVRGYFAGMVPGSGVSVFPEGTAKFLPRGATLVFQVHYTPDGTAVEDRPRIGLKFAAGKPEYELTTRSAFSNRFLIPPNNGNYEIAATHTFDKPHRLYSFSPHSHVRGKAYRYELLSPGGEKKTVLDVPRYDFNWQLEYRLREPIDVPAGTKLKVTAWFDNSKENPANPDPNRAVPFGEQTWDEMMIGYFTGHPLD